MLDRAIRVTRQPVKLVKWLQPPLFNPKLDNMKKYGIIYVENEGS
jgi:hypothetical protein